MIQALLKMLNYPLTKMPVAYYQYYAAYGDGAHSKVLGMGKDSNPYTYGTLEYDAWNNGWEGHQ